MAVIRTNSITKRVSAEIRRISTDGICLAGGMFSAKDLFDCPKKAVLAARRANADNKEEAKEMSDWKWRYAFWRAPLFDVEQEALALGDSEARLHAVVDMVVAYAGERLLVNFRKRDPLPKAPLTGDIADIVVAMYLSGIWSGLLFYYCGDAHVCFFANPDRKACRSIVGGCSDDARRLADHVLHETTPSGEAGKHCSSCPFRGSCDEYQGLFGAEAESERKKV